MGQYHPAAPTDDEGYPVHPERGHHICGRGKNDTSESENGRDRNEYPFCLLAAGQGTDKSTPGAACSHHGGASSGAPPHNDNAARHEMYAERNAYYQRRDEREQALIDAIYDDYREEYERRHGREPLAGDDLKLFGIAVGLHKTELRADDWPDARPDGLDSGHELVDRSEKRTAQGDAYYEYRPAAVLRGKKSVSQDVRMWLKDLGLFNDPDSAQAEATATLAEVIDS